MDLIDTLQKSSSLYPYYDYVHGYGVPRATLYFGIDSVFRGAPSIELEKSPSYLQEAYYTFKYLSNEGTQIFYQILDQKGYIKEYYVVRFGEDSKTGEDYGESPKLYVKNVDKGDKIRVFHRGTFIERIEMRNVLVFVFLRCIQSSVAQDYVVEERFDPLEYGYDSINLNFRAIAGWGITTNTPFQG